ncbi:mutator mutT protein [Geodermatophilus siccatus]|uniref:8-oxo-dGTP diphosphatase n=1 Tax=Geodermatophilus siccatus TaxID=1137991 RepID=A0A1G9LP86_9ACTN|nr:NUDIX domain-containing protein [Geodermatophilus siccatus]SDL63760.1 mutator mutT protein [Geodermatophilus siccatus]
MTRGRHYVVAGVLVRGAAVLMGHRSPDRRWYPDVWDLPGGHVEPGEDEPAALTRELREEVGVVPRGPVLLTRLEDGELRLSLWLVRAWDGDPRNLQPHEHDELRWVRAADLPGLRLAHPAYVDVVCRLVEPGSTAPSGE